MITRQIPFKCPICNGTCYTHKESYRPLRGGDVFEAGDEVKGWPPEHRENEWVAVPGTTFGGKVYVNKDGVNLNFRRKVVEDVRCIACINGIVYGYETIDDSSTFWVNSGPYKPGLTFDSPSKEDEVIRAVPITFTTNESHEKPLPISFPTISGAAAREPILSSGLLYPADSVPILFQQVNPEPPPSEDKEGDGEYLYLKEGDLIEKGDEFELNGEWNTTRLAGKRIPPATTARYRRRLKDLPQQDNPNLYEYLEAGALIKEGDEYNSFFEEGWRPSTEIGSRVSLAAASRKLYRRPRVENFGI